MVGKLGSTVAAVSLGNSYIYCIVFRNRFSTAITPLVAEADAEKMIKKSAPHFTTVAFMHRFRSCIIYSDRVV
jgi:hypothetical protein